MNNLFKFLLLRIEGDDEPVDDEPAPRRISRAEREIQNLRARSQRAEEERSRALSELAEERRKIASGSVAPTQEQEVYAREEAVLRDPNATEWQKYSVHSAREARAANHNSQKALRNAEDLADKTEFASLATKAPKVFEKYKDRVEEMRKQNPGAPRSELLALLVGRDLLSGKVKPADAKQVKQGGVKRGSTPGARSDERSTGNRLTEAEKRAKRLENVRI